MIVVVTVMVLKMINAILARKEHISIDQQHRVCKNAQKIMLFNNIGGGVVVIVDTAQKVKYTTDTCNVVQMD